MQKYYTSEFTINYNNNIAMPILTVVITSFLVLVITCTAQAAPNNCTVYPVPGNQAVLQQVLDLKETCSEAVYKDCCEVS